MVGFPMFPLNSVLFPGVALPLRVFEPRYRRLVVDVMKGDKEFGVCLIERGSEVGGDDVRTDLGTVARIHRATPSADGRWAVLASGVRRIRVGVWLADDPYPRADVEDFDDPVPGEAETTLLPTVTAAVMEAVAKAAELRGIAAPEVRELHDDPVIASYQLSALAPLSTYDKQSLLGVPTVGQRLALLEGLIGEAITTIDARLAGRGDDA